MAHAYLLTGPEGIGKSFLAVEFARALLCAEPAGGEPCGACDPCRKISEGACPDVLKIGAESESGQVKIDQVRALEEFMALTPYGGRCKVGILEGADELTEEATHACLKILEEPPDRSIFILLAAVPHRLAATVVSRCHRVRCGLQGVERVAAWLQEKEKLDASAARMLALASSGRIGLAIQLSKSDRLAKKNSLLDQLLGASRRGELEVSLAKLTRDDIASGLEWYAGWWRDLLVLSIGGEKNWLVHQDRLEDLQKNLDVIARSEATKQSRSIVSEILLDRIERIYRIQEAVQKNANTRTAVAALLSRNA